MASSSVLDHDRKPGMDGSAVLDHVVTADGWRLALHRFEPELLERRHVVVCCHGLASNHLAFDPSPEVSLARHLAARGYRVIAVDLRGHGDSESARWRGGSRRYGWSFDDYLTRDLPAVIARAAGQSSTHAVHWIGHSMGGLLLLAHLARGGSADIRSGVTIGSSLDYSTSTSGFHRLLRLEPLLGALPAVPVGRIAWLSGQLVGRVPTPYERFNVWSSNCEPAVWRRICERGFHSVSPPVMRQLASAMRQGGLRSADGTTRYLDGLAGARAPVLSLVGSRDAQCPPEAAARTVSALSSARVEMRVFGREHGHADDYGHFDLLVGRRATAEVYPSIDTWLDEHD